MKAKTPPAHPAQFSPEIIELFSEIIPRGTRIHDPFGGACVRLGALADALGLRFSAVEIEPEFIKDPRGRAGNSTKRRSYPHSRPLWIVTSPVYPNGVADHFEAKDSSRRRTYRQALAAILGYDRPLHPDNMGRWGYRGTGARSKKRGTFWDIAERCVVNWDIAERVVLNVSDFMHSNGAVEPHVQGWIDLMERHGWKIAQRHQVITQRYSEGSETSRDQRVEAEEIIEFVRAA